MSEAPPPEPELGKTARNERIKLGATLLNNISAAFALAALLQPALSVVQQGRALGAVDLIATLVFAAVSAIFHWAARRSLGGLRD